MVRSLSCNCMLNLNVFITVYLQEVGRAGRDGLQSTATMFWSPMDIGKNIKHMTDDMRAYIKSETCRRKWLAKHFSDPEPKRIAPAHLCCDICARDCDCGCAPPEPSEERNEEVPLPIQDQTLMDTINILLNQYFHLENSQIASPFASSETMLSNTLAKAISNKYTLYTNASKIEEDFPNVQQSYCVNIATIIQAYLSRS